MAYVSPEDKVRLAVGIRAVANKYKMKLTIGVRHYSHLVVKIKSGPLDLIGIHNRLGALIPRDPINPFQPAVGHLEVNKHWYRQYFDGEALKFLTELIAAMEGSEYFDKSDSMTDYFHCSHYITIHVGVWDKAYVHTA